MTPTRQLSLALALAASLLGCGPSSGTGTDQALDHGLRRREAPRVRTAPIEQREMVRILSTTTNVESEVEIDLVPRTAGVIEEVYAEEGDHVEVGAVLAVLDQREAKAALADAQVALQEARDAVPRLELAVQEAAERIERDKLALEQSRAEVQRNEQTGLLSEVDLEKLRLTRDTAERDWQAAKLAHQGAKLDRAKQDTVIARAQLAVERQELNLSYTEITAPFAGVIAARMVKPGDSVTGGASAFTLTDPDRLRAVVYRPQRELSFFRQAQALLAAGDGTGQTGGGVEIRIRAEAFPEEEFEGHIRFLSPTIDPASGSFRLTIDLHQGGTASGGARLLPGMLIRLEIVTERHPDALVVPKRALRREGEAHFAFVVRDGKACRVAVREGFSDDDDVELLPLEPDGLRVGEQVVVVGNRDLEDGNRVETESWSTPVAPDGEAPAEELDVANGGQVSDDSD